MNPTNRFDFNGTIAYRAPELLRGDPPTKKADIYSLAIVLWEMQSGHSPFLLQNPHIVAFGVVAYNLRPESESKTDTNDCSDENNYRNIYRRCWNRVTEKRPPAHQVASLLEAILNM